MNKLKILIILLVGFYGCQKKDSDNIEKRIAEKIAKHIIEKNSLKENKYSREVFLHITSEKLNERKFKTYVSINGLKSESPESRNERLNINGFETIIYYSISKSDFDLPGTFFVPDSKSWRFLAELSGNEIFLSELNIIISDNENWIEEFNEIEF